MTIDVSLGSATLDCPLGSGTISMTGDGLLRFGSGFTLAAGSALAVNGGGLDLGGATIAGLTTVTLAGVSIVNGGLEVAGSIELYSGTMLADLSGPAALEKLGAGTAVLAGNNTYQGGTSALAGTLIVAQADSLPSPATGGGTVIVEPILYWSGSGDWTTGQWELADGTPMPWIDGSSAILAAGSDINVSGSVNIAALTVQGAAAIDGDGTLTLPAWGGTIDVLSGTATVNSTIAGGNLTETGPGTLIVDGSVACAGVTVSQGTLDALSPLPAAPVIAGGRALGPGAVHSSSGQPFYGIDPAMFDLLQSLFADQSIDRTDMIQILQSVAVEGAVTSDALGVLETITSPQGEAALNVPDYVAVLANDVVWGNPANANYQGQPLGNLADQASDQARATCLTDLVDKWFYGDDLPAVAPGLTYDVTAGPLYGDNANPSLNVPSSNDMAQGSLGDCYLVSTLGSIADSSPTAIENMIIPNGVDPDGIESWTVRFYYQNAAGAFVPYYVTVNALLPGYANGSLAYARRARTAPSGSRSLRRHTPNGTKPARRASAARARIATPTLAAGSCRSSTSRCSAPPRRRTGPRTSRRPSRP